MSSIGPSSQAQASALQTAQAQHVAATARDKQKAQATDARRKLQDQVDLRVNGLETNTAVRNLPKKSSEQEREEHEAHDQGRKAAAKKKPSVDIKA